MKDPCETCGMNENTCSGCMAKAAQLLMEMEEEDGDNKPC